MQIDIHPGKHPVSPKSSPSPSCDAVADAIRTAWERGEISQKEVERDLGIHQSQFSKLVNGKFKKPRGHAIRLFEYSIRKRGQRDVGPHAELDAAMLRTELTQGLMRAWDGTEEGARALEAILDGLRRLRSLPSRGK